MQLPVKAIKRVLLNMENPRSLCGEPQQIGKSLETPPIISPSNTIFSQPHFYQLPYQLHNHDPLNHSKLPPAYSEMADQLRDAEEGEINMQPIGHRQMTAARPLMERLVANAGNNSGYRFCTRRCSNSTSACGDCGCHYELRSGSFDFNTPTPMTYLIVVAIIAVIVLVIHYGILSRMFQPFTLDFFG
jgi:hypothetical protein